jgi:hypothetical protein
VISPEFGLLQGALRLSEAQTLELIPTVLTPTVIQERVLGHQHLSQLYRRAGLARLLGISVTDLARVEALVSRPRLLKPGVRRMPHILALLRFKRALDETPFTVNDVWWLLKAEAAGAAGPRVDQARVDGMLEELRTDELLFFTPEALVEIEGVTLAHAQSLLAKLDQRPLNWVVRTWNPERYRLAPTYGLTPDFGPVVAFFIDAGDDPEIADKKAGAIQDRLHRHHPHTLLVARLTEHFNINQDYFEALRPFLATDPSSEAFVNQLFYWLNKPAFREIRVAVRRRPPGDGSDPQGLLALMQALERLLYLFQERLDLPVDSLHFIASRPDLFGITLPTGFRWNSLRLLSIYADFLPDKVEELTEFHQTLASWNDAGFPGTSWPYLLALFKIDHTQLQWLLQNLSLPATPLDALATLARALKLTAKLGLNGGALKQLTAGDYEALDAAKDLVYGAIRAKYQENEWTEIIEPYTDKLNMIKRDALVDRILRASTKV